MTNSPKIYLITIGFYLLTSLIGISYYVGKFYFPKKVILMHMVIVALIYFGHLFIFGLFSKVKAFKSFLKYIATYSLATIFIGIVVLYVLNIVSLTEWGENVSISIAKEFITDIPALIQAVPFKTDSLFIGFGIFLFLVFWLIHVLKDRIFDGLIIVFNQMFYSKLILGLISSFLFISLLIVFQNKGFVLASLKHKGEPIYRFFKPVNVNFSDNSIDLSLGKVNPAVRESYNNHPPFEKKNVIIIIVDAMRPNNMSLFGYERETTPFLKELDDKQKLQKVEFSVSNCATSHCGILSVLSSRNIPNLTCTNYKINDVLKDCGYVTNFILVGSHNEWYQLRRNYEFYGPIDYYMEGPDSKKYTISDDRAIFEFLKKIDNYNKTPSFFYFHMMSAHRSGTKLDQYQKWTPAGKTSYISPEHEIMVNTYDNGILQSDDYIRKIFDHLDEKGYLENSIVVITADHGEAIGERGVYGHSGNVYQEKIRIPIIIYDEMFSEESTIDFGSQIDIAPTILDMMDVDIPEDWEGQSLLNSDTIKYSHHQQSNHLAIIQHKKSSKFKYIYNLKTEKEELFDLTRDPKETENLLKVKSEKSGRIHKKLRRRMKTIFNDF